MGTCSAAWLIPNSVMWKRSSSMLNGWSSTDDKKPDVEGASGASTLAWQTVKDAQATTTASNRLVIVANDLCDDVVHRISVRLKCGRSYASSARINKDNRASLAHHTFRLKLRAHTFCKSSVFS